MQWERGGSTHSMAVLTADRRIEPLPPPERTIETRRSAFQLLGREKWIKEEKLEDTPSLRLRQLVLEDLPGRGAPNAVRLPLRDRTALPPCFPRQLWSFILLAILMINHTHAKLPRELKAPWRSWWSQETPSQMVWKCLCWCSP